MKKLTTIYASLGLPLSLVNGIARFMDNDTYGGRFWSGAAVVWALLLGWSLYRRKKN